MNTILRKLADVLLAIGDGLAKLARKIMPAGGGGPGVEE